VAGRLLTGSDRVADGELHRLADVTRALFEPGAGCSATNVTSTPDPGCCTISPASLVNGPYIWAVSKNVTPRSTAARIRPMPA
jgi:hypothetical protein